MNASALPAPHAPTTAPLALWRVAEAFMHLLHNLFGAPADIARQHAFTAKSYNLFRSWLACAEAMLRRLILIEASAYPKPNTPPPAPRRAHSIRTRAENTGDPETWRVSFRCYGAPASAPAVAAASRASAASTPPGRSPRAMKLCCAPITTRSLMRAVSPAASTPRRSARPACCARPQKRAIASTHTTRLNTAPTSPTAGSTPPEFLRLSAIRKPRRFRRR